jgi:DNA-binding response OmpR family regulator
MKGRPGSSSILLAEFDDAVRALLATILDDAGFVVPTAATTASALAALESGGEAGYHALVLDTALDPHGPSGWEVAELARQSFPTLAVVYLGGPGLETWPAASVAGSVMLAKPFAPQDLLDALESLLDPA